MNKVAQYLQKHLNGEILTSPDVLRYFSTDESIFQLTPQLVVYPRSENDIRKTARFTWQLAEKGRVVPITPRGMGTDLTGGSLGSGIIMALPAHLNKVIELDPKTGVVTVEAGMSLDKLQQVLHTHGRFLPPVSDVNKYATVGGSVSNNDSGRNSYKYGPMQAFIRGLRVVLANGELIETGRISKRELNKKLGLASFEGEIYRSLDKLIEESSESLTKLAEITDHSAAGYDISDVKQKDGSFDLTPLFVGGQGTLGTILEVTFDTEPYNPTRDLLVAGFADRAQGWQAVSALNALKEGPSAVDFIDSSLLTALENINSAVLTPLEGGMPGMLLFIEIDNDGQRIRKKIEKKVSKVLSGAGAEIVIPKESERGSWERLRDSASLYITHVSGKKRAIPVLDDGQVPIDRMTELFKELDGLLEAAGLGEYAAWGQAGTGLIHVAPMLDIASVGDRQKLFKVMDAYYGYICTIGGSVTGEYAEGRMRGLFNNRQFDEKALDIFHKIKKIFDPLGIYNPNVKLDVNADQLKSMIRSDYSLDHQYNHLPRG
ncbi:FAD-binding oxidoreductase [Candidatus Saccharibacteria bacterium]|nr:FAD-binding oxidoreductase [Candidatus Saccharibacteria bacterium]